MLNFKSCWRVILAGLLAGLLVFRAGPGTAQAQRAVSAAQSGVSAQAVPELLARAGIPMEYLRPQGRQAASFGSLAAGVNSQSASAQTLPDPTYRWNTFYGGTDMDSGMSVAIDSSGIYISGYSYASWNGPSGQAPLHAFSGSGDFIVLKLDTAGAYQWHTFYGSTELDLGTGITVKDGGVYIVGSSDAAWNGPTGQAPLHTFSADSVIGAGDILLLKLDINGTYQWHTFYGSDRMDSANKVAIDASGVVVLGESASTWNGPAGQAPLRAHSNDGYGPSDSTVLYLDANGAYQWHAFYEKVGGQGIAADGSAIYITGTSIAAWIGPDGQLPLHAYSGGDIVVIKLDKSGAYQWHTYYGSTADDVGNGIAVAGNDVFVSGYSAATWNGPNGQAPLHVYIGNGDANIMVLKLDINGAYQWHTFYGWLVYSISNAIAIDHGVVYITGYSGSRWLGPYGQAPLHEFGGYGSGHLNLFVLALDVNSTYRWHTFYGGANPLYAQYDVIGYGIAAANGEVYVTGASGNPWEGPSGEAPLHPFKVGDDIGVLKLNSLIHPVYLPAFQN